MSIDVESTDCESCARVGYIRQLVRKLLGCLSSNNSFRSKIIDGYWKLDLPAPIRDCLSEHPLS